MLLKIPVKIVLLDMTLDILIKGEASLVTLVLEGLNLQHNSAPRGDNLLSPQELGMQRPEGLASILGLVKTLAMSPPASEAAPCPLQPCYFDKWDIFADTWDCQYAMGLPLCIFNNLLLIFPISCHLLMSE
jgi:hypothetical protein